MYKDRSNLDSLFINTPDIVILVNAKCVIKQVNDVIHSVLGYSIEDVIEKPFREFIIEKQFNKFQELFSSALKMKPQKTLLRLLHKNGYELDTIIKLIPIVVNDTVENVHLVIEDITLIKKGYDSLLQSEKLYRLMADHSNDIISISTLKGKYLYVSPIAKTILGYEIDELLGKYRSDFLHPKDIKAFESRVNKIKGKDQLATYLYPFPKKDGSLVWLESAIKYMINDETNEELILTMSRDLTERIKSEELLKEQEAHYRLLVEESPYAIIIANDQHILYINETGSNLFGIKDRNNLKDLKPLDYIHPDYHSMVIERMTKVKNNQVVELAEEKWLRMDGSVIDVAVKSIPTIFDGKPARYIVVLDISEQKKTMEMMQKSEKLSLVGQLAAGMAHEIRNPLTALKGFLQLIQINGEVKQEYIDIMWHEFNQIEMIVSELLVLAKPQVRTMSLNNIIPLIEQALVLVNTQAILHDIEIDKNYLVKDLFVTCDANQIKQVLINIIKNGIEAMPNGGNISIEVLKEKNNAVIRIIDQGIGITQKNLKRIGEPFYTTKEKGTGLGMMVSYKIIESHHGKLNIKSKENIGTTFEIILPIK